MTDLYRTTSWKQLRAQILELAHDPSRTAAELQLPSVLRVLIVVEGILEIQFLRRISRIQHGSDFRLPNLAQ